MLRLWDESSSIRDFSALAVLIGLLEKVSIDEAGALEDRKVNPGG